MALRLDAHPSVRPELQRLADELDRMAYGLGEEFIRAAGAAFERIYENPAAWPVVHGPLRRHKITGFDVSVYYELSDEAIYILGVS